MKIIKPLAESILKIILIILSLHALGNNKQLYNTLIGGSAILHITIITGTLLLIAFWAILPAIEEMLNTAIETENETKTTKKRRNLIRNTSSH